MKVKVFSDRNSKVLMILAVAAVLFFIWGFSFGKDSKFPLASEAPETFACTDDYNSYYKVNVSGIPIIGPATAEYSLKLDSATGTVFYTGTSLTSGLWWQLIGDGFPMMRYPVSEEKDINDFLSLFDSSVVPIAHAQFPPFPVPPTTPVPPVTPPAPGPIITPGPLVTPPSVPVPPPPTSFWRKCWRFGLNIAKPVGVFATALIPANILVNGVSDDGFLVIIERMAKTACDGESRNLMVATLAYNSTLGPVDAYTQADIVAFITYLRDGGGAAPGSDKETRCKGMYNWLRIGKGETPERFKEILSVRGWTIALTALGDATVQSQEITDLIDARNDAQAQLVADRNDLTALYDETVDPLLTIGQILDLNGFGDGTGGPYSIRQMLDRLVNTLDPINLPFGMTRPTASSYFVTYINREDVLRMRITQGEVFIIKTNLDIDFVRDQEIFEALTWSEMGAFDLTGLVEE